MVSTTLIRMMKDKDTEKVKRVTAAMMKMNKLIIADFEKAYEN
ncbi:MAG: hypothetical protein RLN85_01700 [Pseudomonadales bacterium]